MFKMMDGSPPTQIPPSNFLYRLDKLAYSTPPPVSSDPANNECRIIEYRGAKLASFNIDGDVMICLPQAFDLFLKHLVGGLHTVYTKLKRLNITPVVCNVEQVRILRGLGAIQPGVNRCKLLTRKQFDVLYEDCTTASSRPGRPPKRSLPISLHHHLHGVHATGHPLDLLKRQKIDNGLTFGYDGLATSPYLMAHHPAFLPTSLAMASHLSAISRQTDAPETSDNEHQSPSPTAMTSQHSLMNGKSSPPVSEASHEAASSSQSNIVSSDEEGRGKENGDDDELSGNEALSYDSRKVKISEHNDTIGTTVRTSSAPVSSNSTYQTYAADHGDKMSLHRQALSTAGDLLSAQGPSSMETLLTNIQGLLKVAADNARQQEKQSHLQSAELKLELLREKELRESLGKQLAAEQRRTAILLKRLKKEKKARRRLAEQIGADSTNTVENGEVPPSSTEAVTKINGEPMRVNNETFQDGGEGQKHDNPEDNSSFDVHGHVKPVRSPIVGYNSH